MMYIYNLFIKVVITYKITLLRLWILILISCKKPEIVKNVSNITSPSTTISDINESDLLKLKLPKGVKKEYIKWNKAINQITFVRSTRFSDMTNTDLDKEGFYWSVPPTIKNIIIEKNVIITGGFRASSALTIEGKERTSSEIFGTNTKAWSLGSDGQTDPNSSCHAGAKGDDRVHDCEKWKYGAISSTGPNSSTLTIKNLTITNARSYAITSFTAKIIMDNVYVRITRPQPDFHSNSDGISAGAGSIVKNSKFDCWDDAIKLYRDLNVENVTIIHNSNGAPFQLGWGNDINNTIHSIKNVLIEVKNKNYTNLALFSASLSSGKVNRNVSIDGLKVNYEDFQKIQNKDPLPLFLMRSPDAILNLNAQNVSMKAPSGIGGLGKVNLKICGSTEIQNNYECGNIANVIGCGW
jgi:hypothetical protein